jgi:tryptophan halogenase
MKKLKIVIVGAGAAGYFAAAAIKRNCPTHEVIVVSDPNTPHIGVGEAIAWNGPHFMQVVLGLKDFQWMKDSQSAWKFAVRHRGFHGDDRPDYAWSFPFNPTARLLSASLWDSKYHLRTTKMTDTPPTTMYDVWLHLKAKGLLDTYNPQQDTHELQHFAEQNKSVIEDDGQWVVSAYAGHSYHINSFYIKDVVHNLVGKPAGVKDVQIKVKDVVLTPDGAIDYLLLDNEEKMHADLFIDSTGLKRLLVSKMSSDFVELDEYCNDSSLVSLHKYESPDEYTNYTLHHAMDHGWRFSISMQDRCGEGYTYNSRINNNEDQFVDEHVKKSGHKDLNFRKFSWTPGYYKNSIVKNCLALGLSYGMSDVFDANNFSSTLRQIEKLVEMLKKDPEATNNWVEKYNRYVEGITADVYFRIQCAFHLAPRNDTVYWQTMKEAADKFNTKQKLIDTVFEPNRKVVTSLDNPVSYIQHTWINQCAFYDIPIYKDPRCIRPEIDDVTEQLALNWFKFFNNKNRIVAENSRSMNDFYKNIYPNITVSNTGDNLSNYTDYLG